MNEINKTKSIFKKDLLSSPIFYSAKVINPRRDWNILAGLCFLFIIFSIAFDYCMYRKTVNGDMYVSIKREEIKVEDLKTKDIESVLSIFENKQKIITDLKVEKLVDPSL